MARNAVQPWPEVVTDEQAGTERPLRQVRTLESAPELDRASGSILPQRESEPWT